MTTLRRLHNAGWGFESNCFVCEDANARGLRIPFFHDTARDVVVAELDLGEAFSGAPQYVHGGVLLAVLDEAMAWAAIAVAGKWAVTRDVSATYHRPVKVGRLHRVEARIVSADESEIEASARVVRVREGDGGDRDASVEARAVLVPVGEAQAVEAIGGEVPAEHAGFLRG